MFCSGQDSMLGCNYTLLIHSKSETQYETETEADY
jgi:hypothetical protein